MHVAQMNHREPFHKHSALLSGCMRQNTLGAISTNP